MVGDVIVSFCGKVEPPLSFFFLLAAAITSEHE